MKGRNIEFDVIKQVESGFSFVLFILLILSVVMTKKLDNYILLENLHPRYWESFSSGNTLGFYTQKSRSRDGDEGGNLVILNNRYYLPASIQVKLGSDGTMIIEGELNNEGEYLHLTPGGYYLSPGRYAVSFGDMLSLYGMYALLESYKDDGGKEVIARFDGKEVEFDIDVCKNVNLILFIPKGNYSQGITFRPSIIQLNKKSLLTASEEFSQRSYFRDSKKIRINYIDRKRITEQDWIIFNNQIRFLRKEYEWFSVIDENYHCIQYMSDGRVFEGQSDSLGRIVDGYITFYEEKNK